MYLEAKRYFFSFHTQKYWLQCSETQNIAILKLYSLNREINFCHLILYFSELFIYKHFPYYLIWYC